MKDQLWLFNVVFFFFAFIILFSFSLPLTVVPQVASVFYADVCYTPKKMSCNQVELERLATFNGLSVKLIKLMDAYMHVRSG